MTKTKIKKHKKQEIDSVYFLKMLVYLIMGSFWIRLTYDGGNSQIPLPVGMFLGLYLASREKLQIDRKLEYAILIMAMFFGFWLPLGLVINLQ